MTKSELVSQVSPISVVPFHWYISMEEFLKDPLERFLKELAFEKILKKLPSKRMHGKAFEAILAEISEAIL